jgi:hypothetical protein
MESSAATAAAPSSAARATAAAVSVTRRLSLFATGAGEVSCEISEASGVSQVASSCRLALAFGTAACQQRQTACDVIDNNNSALSSDYT